MNFKVGDRVRRATHYNYNEYIDLYHREGTVISIDASIKVKWNESLPNGQTTWTQPPEDWEYFKINWKERIQNGS